jgi:hypothetical protein
VAFLDGSAVFLDLLRHPRRPRQPRLRVDVAVAARAAVVVAPAAVVVAPAAADAAFNSIQKL